MPSLWTRAEEVVRAVVEQERREMAGKLAIADQTTAVESNEWMVIVNLVILVCTVLGAGMIITSMCINEFFRGRPGTTRTRIVQALIISDLVLGIVGLISSALTLSDGGKHIAHGTVSCSGLGFMLTSVLWTEHLWTVTLAVATYMILIYPLHAFTLWLEKKWYYLWAAVWVTSMAIGLIGYLVWGYYPAGGVCYYGDNTGLYAELIQFIPRAVVCITITILYSRLFVFLRRPDRIRAPHSNSSTGVVTYETNSTQPRRRSRISSLANIFKRNHAPSQGAGLQLAGVSPLEATKLHIGEGSGSGSGANDSEENATRRPSKVAFHPEQVPASPPANWADLPPWERIDLPAFQIDGERFGGPSSPTSAPVSLWSGWKGLGGKKRPSASSTFNPPGSPPTAHTVSRFGSVSSAGEAPESYKPPAGSLTAPKMESIPSGHDMGFTPFYSPVQPQSLHEIQRDSTPGHGALRKGSSGSTMVDPMSPTWPLSPGTTFGHVSPPSSEWTTPTSERHRPSITTAVDEIEMSSRKSSVPSEVEKTPQQPPALIQPQPIHLPQPLQPLRETDTQPSSYQQTPPQSRTQSPHLLSSRSPSPRRGQPSPLPNHTKSQNGARSQTLSQAELGTTEPEGEEEWDLLKMLSEAPATSDDRFAPPTSNGEYVELVPESMASYLNRKTALLMLWFPLGYVILFSVSFIRLIYDFAGDPPTSLRAISRWLVLSQGLLDAIIYGFVEWHTKRVVRKHVRKGTFSPHHSVSATNGSKIGNAARAMQGFANRVSGGRTGTPTGGGTGTGSRTGAGTGGFGTGSGLGVTPGQTQSQGQTGSVQGPERHTRSALGRTRKDLDESDSKRGSDAGIVELER
ncbi:hypothetical protein IAT38_005307 [Cryptococcus sp. DSM 104549]